MTTTEIPANLPRHVAVIMDGNGRWAEARGLKRLEGHKQGAQSVRTIVECCRKWGISYLTLFSFSTENWRRTEDEVSGLMKLLDYHLKSQLKNMCKHGIRLRVIGDLSRLPKGLQKSLLKNIEKTKGNSGLTLVLALSYGAREEIVAAAQSIARDVQRGVLVPEDIDAQCFAGRLWTCDFPDPDLLIRTSGEMRISNFLLWQLAYTEIIVTQCYWPDFGESEFRACLEEYAGRERRFGRTSSQLGRLQDGKVE